MNSRLTHEFIAAFAALPDRIKRPARKNYRFWSQNPAHPSLDFKRIGNSVPAYYIRVGIGWRALGVHDETDDTITWFWIGSHAEYDGILRRMG